MIGGGGNLLALGAVVASFLISPVLGSMLILACAVSITGMPVYLDPIADFVRGKLDRQDARRAEKHAAFAARDAKSKLRGMAPATSSFSKVAPRSLTGAPAAVATPRAQRTFNI